MATSGRAGRCEDHGLDLVEGSERSGPSLIHDTVLQIMLLIVPYMGEAGPDILDGMLERHRDLTRG